MRLFRRDATGLTAALAANNSIEIDNSIAIATGVTVPVGKTLTVTEGAVISGAGTLTISGGFEAGNYQVFDNALEVVFKPTARKNFKPEWFGATPLTNYTIPNVDSYAAFSKAINSSDNPNYPGEGKYFAVTLELTGAYSISDTIECISKTVNFIGQSQGPGGSQIRWLDGSTGMTEKALILFDGSNYSRLENLSLQATAVDEEDTPMFAAIQLTYNTTLADPQRSLTFKNLTIGQGVGNENVTPGFWSFQYGVICGTGDPVVDFNNANCDFLVLENIKIGHCEIGIANHYSQALDWLYKQITIINCGIGMQFNQGGNFIADSVYFDRGMIIGCIKGPLASFDSLRFSAKVSTEHLKCQYFLHSDGPVYGTFEGGLIQVAFAEQIIPTGIFYLLKGDCMKYDSQVTFDGVTFGSSGTGKIAIDLPGTGSESRVINFINCVSVDGLWLKFPNANTYSDVTYINIIDHSRNFNLTINSRHPLLSGLDATNSCYWLSLGDVLAELKTDIQASIVTIGNRGRGPVMEIHNPIPYWRQSEAVNTLTYDDIFEPDTTYDGVTVIALVSGLLSNGAHYIKVGTAASPELFGRITGTSAGAKNSVTSTGGIVFTTATDLILTSFDGSNNPVNMVTGKGISVNLTYRKFGQRASEVSPNDWGSWQTWGAD